MKPPVAPFPEPDASAVRAAVLGQLKGVLVAFAGVLVFGLIPVAGNWYPSTVETWALMLGWVVLFAVTYLGQTSFLFGRAVDGRQKPADPPDERTVNYLVSIFMGIGAIGAIAVIYDFAILRGYGVTTSAATIRLEEVIASLKGLSTSSPISGAGRLAIPAFIPAVILMVLYWRQVSTVTKAIAGASIVILLLEQFGFEGGRFFLTATAICAVLAALLSPALAANRRRLLANTGLLVRVGMLGLVLFAFFSYVFVARIVDRDGFFWSAFINYASNFYIDIDRSTIQRFSGFFGGIWFSITMLWMYATQGLTEFDQIVRTAYFTHAYGGYQFLQITQITDALFGTNWTYNRFVNLPHAGTYITLPGAFYVDFGPWMALLSGPFLGFFSARASWLMASGRINALALSAPIFLTCSYLAGILSVVQILWPAVAWCALLPLIRTQFEASSERKGRAVSRAF